MKVTLIDDDRYRKHVGEGPPSFKYFKLGAWTQVAQSCEVLRVGSQLTRSAKNDLLYHFCILKNALINCTLMTSPEKAIEALSIYNLWRGAQVRSEAQQIAEHASRSDFSTSSWTSHNEALKLGISRRCKGNNVISSRELSKWIRLWAPNQLYCSLVGCYVHYAYKSQDLYRGINTISLCTR